MLQASSGLKREDVDIVLNGLTYRFAIMRSDETCFTPPERLRSGRTLSKADVDGFWAALTVLEELAQRVNELNERLVDSADGLTSRGAWILMLSPAIPEDFKRKFMPYALGLLRHGTNVLTERSCVVVPPAPREEFERQIALLDPCTRKGFHWTTWLDQVFDPVPWATQGFYLFETREDRERYVKSLGREYADVCSQMRELFGRGVDPKGGLGQEQWALLDRLSQRAMDLQKGPLEEALSQAPAACRDVATRVRVACDGQGRIRLRATHYSEEFAPLLRGCADLLMQAGEVVPSYAKQLRSVLADLAQWCTDQSANPTWAESRLSWIASDDPDNLIDVNLTFEEKVSRIGSKGGLQLLTCAFDSVPGSVKGIYDRVREQGRRQNLNILFLKQLLVGGGASHYTLAGEKLPDPAGRDCYKVMIFTNTTKMGLVLMNRELIASATDWPAEEIGRVAEAAKLLVLFHEYGHTLGDFAEFLGDLGCSVEETNAEASSIYETHKLAPDHLEPALVLEACWTPVRRAMQGPSESHSHANIVLFDELLRAGAIRVVQEGSRMLVRLIDPAITVTVSFATAWRMRLWEIGIPTEQQCALIEPFDPADGEQDDRLGRLARRWLDTIDEESRAAMRQRVVEECRAYFATDRLNEISKPLRQVIATMPQFQPVAVIPTDRRYGSVLSF